MPKRAVKHPPTTMHPLPCDWHLNAFDPGTIVSGKSCPGQNMVARVDMHVVLLRLVVKIFDPFRDRIALINDVHLVRNGISRMSNKLSAGHELVVRVGAKTVSQSSVKSGKP